MSNKKITELTQAQKDKLPECRDKWIKIGLNCDPTDYDKSVEAICRAYRVAGLEPPPLDKFVYVDSPLAAVMVAALINTIERLSHKEKQAAFEADKPTTKANGVYDKVISVVAGLIDETEDFVRTVFTIYHKEVAKEAQTATGNMAYGSHDAGWLTFYDYFLDVIGLESVEPLRPLIDLASVCGWWLPYEELCIITNRHSEVHMDDQNRLHNPNGPAVLYSDGWGIYAWHGTRLAPDRAWIIKNPEKVTAQAINTETNVELRRIMMEVMDPERFLLESESRLIDENLERRVQLLEISTNYGIIQVTKSTCPSTGRQYIEYLGSNIFTTVQEAQDWQFRSDEVGVAYNPTIET